MATDSRPAADAAPTDYQAISEPAAKLNAEVRFAPTCMFWAMMGGLAALALVVLAWAIPSISAMDWGLLFR